MSTQVLVLFTSKLVSTIFNEGGTQAWDLDRAHARRCVYAVLCRHTRGRNAPPKDQVPEPHGSAFLVGRISDVVRATRVHPEAKRKDRWKILFDQYAEISVPNVWKGWHNPVRYRALDDLGIDIERLDFKPMPALRPEET
jgi:hypothetical protein